MKRKVGFILGVLAFFLIYFSVPVKGMWFSAFKTVLKHSSPDLIQRVGVGPKDLRLEQIDTLIEDAKKIKVIIPKDFSETGERGIELDSDGRSKTTLHDAVKIQVTGLKNSLAMGVLMAIFWLAAVLPVPVVALFPMLFLPLLGIASTSSVSMPGYFMAFAPYMHYLVVLFIGGFTIAEAMKKWGLHERIALKCMSVVGFSPKKIMFSFMAATALISMFVSNTATAAMMMPIAVAIIIGAGENPDDSRFGKALMLGIAYAASIGGIGTLIGTPPNLIFAGFADTLLGKTITFTDWLFVGIPIVVIFLPITWIYLVWINKVKGFKIAGSREIVRNKLNSLGRLRGGELNTLIIFVTVALLWIFRELWTNALGLYWVNDSVVAIFALILFYIVPVNIRKWEFTLDWKTNLRIPWGTLLLFGGGIALGEALANTGAAEFLAMNLFALKNVHMIVILFVIITLVHFLTEVTSNTATTNMMMPILYFLGIALGEDPLIFMLAGAVAASMAFMLPVGTPPNAVVYGSGYVEVSDMVKCGFWLHWITIILWTVILYFVAPAIQKYF